MRHGLASSAVVTLLLGCSGGGGGGGGAAPTLELTEESTKGILSTAAATLPGCTYSATAALPAAPASSAELGTLVQKLAIDETNPFGPLALRGSRPADKTGECGGTRTFSDYSHTSGITRGTMVFDAYCRKSDTGEPTTFDGELAFVDTGVSTDSGPMRSAFTAEAPELTATTRGQTYDIALTGFRYAVTTRGSQGTDEKPDVMTVGSVTVKDSEGELVHKVSGYVVEVGTTKVKSSGTVCDPSGCVGVKTDPEAPLTIGGGQIQSGTLIITGTKGTTATAEFVPGPTPTLQITSINGVDQPSGSIAQETCAPLPPLSL